VRREILMIAQSLSKLDDPYLDLLKKCLTRYIFPDSYRPLHRPSRDKHPIAWLFYPALAAILGRKGVALYRYVKFDPVVRSEGRDWPPTRGRHNDWPQAYRQPARLHPNHNSRSSSWGLYRDWRMASRWGMYFHAGKCLWRPDSQDMGCRFV